MFSAADLEFSATLATKLYRKAFFSAAWVGTKPGPWTGLWTGLLTQFWTQLWNFNNAFCILGNNVVFITSHAQ